MEVSYPVHYNGNECSFIFLDINVKYYRRSEVTRSCFVAIYEVLAKNQSGKSCRGEIPCLRVKIEVLTKQNEFASRKAMIIAHWELMHEW